MQIARGLVGETRGILELGFSASLPVLSGLAYGQRCVYLTSEVSLEEAVQQYKYATHALARRQDNLVSSRAAIAVATGRLGCSEPNGGSDGGGLSRPCFIGRTGSKYAKIG